MIIYYIFTFLSGVGGLLLSVLPKVDTLPFGIDAILVTMVGYFHGAMVTIPYLQVVWSCFLWILLFEVLLLVAKFVFGSRLPANHVN